ncbi:MAG: hypothetical protein JWR69_3791 [Pedosphaera sp.]|nr:hypothetical protein [Pedosphaera sp.]
MSTTDQTLPPAWEPLTPRGVAAFAGASLRRLLLVQFIIAVLAAAVVVWTLQVAWFPVVREAIRQLPVKGEIAAQQLVWTDATPVQLAGNHFLGLAVDLNHGGELGREAQLQVEFGRKNVRVFSLLGYQIVEYPAGWRVAFNRTELGPWWGAWEPGILAGAAFGTVAGLMLTWTLLATLYCLPVRLITFLQNRDLNLRQSWRVAGAALMPGALFLTFAIFSYGLDLVDLIRLAGLAGLHFVIGWVYLFISPLFLPRIPALAGAKTNPFVPPPELKKEAAEKNPSAAGEKPAS